MRVLVSDASILIDLAKWSLLTGDKRMRTLAEQEQVEVHGILWLIDRFAEHRIVRKVVLANTLKGMLEDPRTRVPHAEIKKRLTQFAAK